MSEIKKTVYLVDDDITNLTIGRNILNAHYSVLSLDSGTRLLKVLERKVPDLILLDVDMPEMDGYETIKHIRNSGFADVPVIFLTAKNDSESELEGLSLGAIDYITKPFSPSLLLKRIEVHLLIESQKQELVRFNNDLKEMVEIVESQKKELELFNNNLQEMVDKKTKEVLELQNAILTAMSELVESRDAVTGSHIERTKGYLHILISALKETELYADIIADWDIDLILQSSQLHDVGKIAVSDSILRKPGRLTNSEFEEMKLHTVFSNIVIEKIIKNTSQHDFLVQAKIMASTHHEKWDGNGYPTGLKGKEIPLQGRLMAIADVYDALVSTRPYKKAFSHEEAVAIIKNDSGSHFEPELVELFEQVSEEFRKIAATAS